MTSVGTLSAGDRIEQAFRDASRTTGTSFDYLLTTAAKESSMRPSVEAKSSSAMGLFQFIESTWLETMKESGANLGLGKYAEMITRTKGGAYTVADPAARDKILKLRADPKVASLMAGAFTHKNALALEEALGRQPTNGELYMAHFLGLSGAKRLISMATSKPETTAASVFPTQAKANKAVFYSGKGKALSVSRLYSKLSAVHGGETTTVASAGTAAAATKTATGGTATKAAETAKSGTGTTGEGGETAPVLAFAAPTDKASRRIADAWKAADTDSAFRALFRNQGGPASALSPNAWSAFTANGASLFTASTDAKSTFVASLYTSPAGDTATDTKGATGKSATAVKASGADGAPTDFTRFLKRKSWGQPKDLLPPA